MNIPTGLTTAEIRGDLAHGVHERISRAAWQAKLACEEITKDGCRGAEAAIAAARRHLGDVQRLLDAFRELTGQGTK